MSLHKVTILLITLLGFALRLYYLTHTHPFFDEYTTVLASRQILNQGWPVLPSGLFYEHGLLTTYLIAPFTALFISTPITEWQPAHWGLMLSRWPSLLISTATIPLIYAISLKGNTLQSPIPNHHPALALLAAGLFALSPEGMVWGGRARMYALATMLVLLTVYFVYRGSIYPASAKYRWLALATLLATLLTQFGAMLLIPPLLIAMLTIAWFSSSMPHVPRSPSHVPRPWFLRPAIIPEGIALTILILIAILVKRLGRPIGTTSLEQVESGNILTELINTIAYQTAFYFTWPDTVKFLGRQFGVTHHYWLVLFTLAGSVIGLIFWAIQKNKTRRMTNAERRTENSQSQITNPQSPNLLKQSVFSLFLWLTFGLIILEMITLLEPFRRNPRYIVMYLPLFYLIAAHAIFQFRHIPALFSRSTFHVPRTTYTLISITLLIALTFINTPDLKIALLTPEPAYEEAFAHIQNQWQPDDILLTMNTPAAALYMGQVDGFTVQNEADQFLLNADTQPVDRWLGTPWLGTITDFNTALNSAPRSWFVIDTIRQPVYFRGDWQATLNSQMEQVWANDNALIYRTRPDRVPLSTHPDTNINVTLGDSIQLIGYTLQSPTAQSPNPPISTTPPNSINPIQLTLFWQSLTPLSTDYTIFLHLRDSQENTVAQKDSQPFDGAYPTSRWQPNETIIDPFTWPLPPDLPPGTYTLYTGLYQLDTRQRLPITNDTTGENAIPLGDITLP